jgi:hypothetical protein
MCLLFASWFAPTDMPAAAAAAAAPAKVAVGLYGLLRHPCTIGAFLWSLGSLAGAHDLFVSAAYERLPYSPRSGEFRDVRVHLGAFSGLLDASTSFAVESQSSIDMQVNERFRQALGYGDVWSSETSGAPSPWGTFSVNGSTVRNTMRALHLMRRLTQLVEAHEVQRGVAYEYVVSTRVDVFFTRRLPPLPVWPTAGVAASNYADFGYTYPERGPRSSLTLEGMNDRFMLGERASVLRLMRRSDLLPRWFEEMNRAYVPEVFLRWACMKLNISVQSTARNDWGGRQVPLGNVRVGVYAGYNRRVRASGSLVKAQYSASIANNGSRVLSNCRLDTMPTCQQYGPADLRACEEAWPANAAAAPVAVPNAELGAAAELPEASKRRRPMVGGGGGRAGRIQTRRAARRKRIRKRAGHARGRWSG